MASIATAEECQRPYVAGLVKVTFTATLGGPDKRLLANGLLLTLRLNRFLKLPLKVTAKLKNSFGKRPSGNNPASGDTGVWHRGSAAT